MHRTFAALALVALLTVAGCSVGPQQDATTTITTTTGIGTGPGPTSSAGGTTATTAASSTTVGTSGSPDDSVGVRTGGFTDAPPSGRATVVPEGTLHDLPRLYRRHYRAAGDRSFRFAATITAIRNGSRSARLAVQSRRGPATLDRTRLVQRTDDPLGNGTVRRVEVRATYREPEGPDRFYRRTALDDEEVDRTAGIAQGVPLERALAYTVPWGYRDLVVRLAAAGDYGDGERVTVDGGMRTRYRTRSVDRSAFEALSVGDRPAGLWLVAGDAPYGAAVPERYRSTVLVDDAGLVRRVNLTLRGPRRDGRSTAAPTTVRVTARFEPGEVTGDPPQWVRRTPRLRVTPLPVDGLALAIEHRGGPTVRIGGSLETGTRRSRTLFPMLPSGPFASGDVLYLVLSPDDDGNRMELRTRLGTRPDGPFVDEPLWAFSLSWTPAEPAGGPPPLTGEHLVGVDRPSNRTARRP